MLRDTNGGHQFQNTICIMGCSSLVRSFSLFENVGLGSFSSFFVGFPSRVVCRFTSYNYLCP